ncbi:ABC-type nitrate/sulfonate/bicarbonate transport system substrate-binding protein [Nitrobacteraceae bacterium AZCC 2146]
MSPVSLLRALTIGATVMLTGLSPTAAETKLDKVSFGTNWVAEAEHGGFFQAVADGTYKSYGLDVTIVPGGPNVNNRILLISGKLDFFMSANTLQSFDAVANDIPVVAVAAVFQKDPQIFLAHPNPKVTKLEDLKPLTLLISKEGVAGYLQWLKSEHGFSEARVKPYTYNAQPFIVDKNSAMQGYVTSEPFVVEKQAGFKPTVILLADYGFDGYSTLIETRRDLVDKKPDLVQRFVDALDDRLVQLSLRRQQSCQRRDQETQPGNDRRAAGLFHRQDEGIRHRRFRRHRARRHRRHDRGARRQLLRQDVARGRGQARHRLSPCLHAAIRQQGRRRRSQAEEVSPARWPIPRCQFTTVTPQ